jgi:hypothetical protein
VESQVSSAAADEIWQAAEKLRSVTWLMNPTEPTYFQQYQQLRSADSGNSRQALKSRATDQQAGNFKIMFKSEIAQGEYHNGSMQRFFGHNSPFLL